MSAKATNISTDSSAASDDGENMLSASQPQVFAVVRGPYETTGVTAPVLDAG
jgi:hypothetical protein